MAIAGGVVARVFISHAGTDRAWADEIHGWLVAERHEVFLDQHPVDGLAAGEEWEQRLYERLRWADAVVCVITPTYLRSTWCAIEIGIAKTLGSRLLPVRAAAGATHPLLKSIQQPDAVADADAARAGLARSLRALDAGGGSGWPDDQSPYPGLASFETAQHRVFFGRAREASAIAERLRAPAFRSTPSVLLVIGPSGCGKSSLVRAGVIPLIAEENYWLPMEPMTPGVDPVGALARTLAIARRRTGLDWQLSSVRDRLAKDGLREVSDEILIADESSRRRKLLLVVDQFEELFRRAEPAQRAEFTELLAPAIGGPVQVLATLRTEFLDQMIVDPAMSSLSTETYPLRPLRKGGLREVIERPARVAGFRIDDGLVTELLADTDSGEALPLLAFALERLADGVHRGGTLSLQRYDETGGVRGALVRQAEVALAEARAATTLTDNQIIDVMLRLVTVDERGVPTRARIPRDELTETDATVVDAFVTQRLLTIDEEDRRIVVSAAHEAFLQHWPLLRDAIEKEGKALRARRAIEEAAADWKQDRAATRLWERGRLESAMDDTGARMRVQRRPNLRTWPPRLRRLATNRVDLSSSAKEFLERSYRRDRFRRGRATAVLSTLLVAALVAATIAVIQQRKAVDQQRTTVARALLTDARDVFDGEPRTTIRLALAADAIHPSVETRNWLVKRLASTYYGGTLDGNGRDVSHTVFSPDGHMLAVQTYDGVIALWDLTDPRGPRRYGDPLTGPSTLAEPVFSPDGRRLLTGAGIDIDARNARLGMVSHDHTFDGNGLEGVLEWDVSDPSHRLVGKRLLPDIDEKTQMVLDSGGAFGVTFGWTQPTRLWDFTGPPRAVTLATQEQHADAVAISPDRRTLATGVPGGVFLWDVSDLGTPHQIGRIEAQLPGRSPLGPDALAFSPGGGILAVYLDLAGLTRWDVGDPTRPQQLGAAMRATRHFAFAPATGRLAVAYGNAAYLYDLDDPANPRQWSGAWVGQPSDVSAVGVASTGRVATGARDGRVTLWDSEFRVQPKPAGPSLYGSFDRKRPPCCVTTVGDLMAIGGANGNVDLWDISNSRVPLRLATWNAEHVDFSRNDHRLSAVALSADGKTVATGGPDRTVSLWDISDRAHPRRLGPPLTGLGGIVRAIVFTPDGNRLAAGSDKNSLVWDISKRETPRRIGRGLRDRQITGLTFTDGRLLALGWNGGNAALWDLTNPDEPSLAGMAPTRVMVGRLAYSPAARVLVTSSTDKTIQLWDMKDLAHPRRLGDPLRDTMGGDVDVIFDQTGRLLAELGLDGRILLWDITDPARPVQVGDPIDARADAVAGAQLSTDGDTLVAVYSDGPAVIWDLSALNELRRRTVEIACTTVGTGLDSAGWQQYIPTIEYRRTCP
ncbi:TIR domain-containing protein [Nocardia sp. NPDC051911]|uniref:nSTAND1 domain-containing NTPase n=1 Tax=Nocardia sp. NPDC051911 TaxID=3154648 RepID=UPI00344999B1